MVSTTPPEDRRRWDLASPITAQASEALRAYPPVIRQLLAGRGVTSRAQAERYFSMDRAGMSSPLLLPDMGRGVDRVLRALLSGERIAIHGDFDADGVTATALLAEALGSLGTEPITYIPHRVDEGHGTGLRALNWLAGQGVTLVITADCGIGGVGETGRVPRGLDIVVTDHHLPSERLPDAIAAIDPMRADSIYPSPELAGVGVAFKLVQALFDALGRQWDDRLLELVAIGTIADVAPLTGENRMLVREGLAMLRSTQRLGLRALAAKAGVDLKALDEETIGFAIGPRINAAGRMLHADIALQLLRSRNTDEADAIADELNELNTQRQVATTRVVTRARELVLERGDVEPIIMVGAEEFPPGIVGLAASRLAEEFQRPALVFSHGLDQIRGSARSIPGFDITSALTRCASLLTRYGGHHQAAGFSAPTANLAALRSQLIAVAGEMLDGADLRPTLRLDAEAQPSALMGDVIRQVQRMAPFGNGNPAPIFLATNMEVRSARTIGGDRTHLRMNLREPGPNVAWGAIAFRQGGFESTARGRIDIAYRLRAGWANGPTPNEMEVEVLDFRPAAGRG